MKCFYINLDAQVGRRERIEGSFSEHRQGGWEISRFSAVNTDDVRDMQADGSARPAEKACFLSHRKLIESRLGDDDPIFVLEDDAEFGRRTCEMVDSALEKLRGKEWDIVFTDLCIPGIQTMVDLIRLRGHEEVRRDGILIDLSGIVFAGSTAYVVNGRSKAKVWNILEGCKFIDSPYDLFLREMIYEKKLTACLLFPFATTLSNFSQESSIREIDEGAPDVVWNLFRKMVWADRDMSACKQQADYLRQSVSSEEADMYSALFLATISEKYQPR